MVAEGEDGLDLNRKEMVGGADHPVVKRALNALH